MLVWYLRPLRCWTTQIMQDWIQCSHIFMLHYLRFHLVFFSHVTPTIYHKNSDSSRCLYEMFYSEGGAAPLRCISIHSKGEARRGIPPRWGECPLLIPWRNGISWLRTGLKKSRYAKEDNRQGQLSSCAGVYVWWMRRSRLLILRHRECIPGVDW